MYDFQYHRPKSVADAVAALKKASDGKLIAGGQTLLPTLKQRLAQPSDLVDLSGVAELRGIKVEGNAVVIGAPGKVVREVTTIQHRCCVCGTWFEPERSDATYCNQACRSRAYRRRKKEAAQAQRQEDNERGSELEPLGLARTAVGSAPR